MHKGQMTLEHKRKLEEGRLRWQHSTKGKPKKVKATIKQIRTLQYMNQGMSRRKAQLKAGYSQAHADIPKHIFFKKKGVQQMIVDMAEQLVNQDLTTQYMAIKFKQWIEAKNDKGNPDTKQQIDAYREWKKVMDQHQEAESGLKMKRKLTIEEFVMDGKKEKAIDITPIEKTDA